MDSNLPHFTSGVFVFRYEDAEVYALIHPALPPSAPAAPPPGVAGVPVVYKLDMKNPASYFAAQRFLMRDNDVLYVSNAVGADLQKAFRIVSGSVGTASQIESLRNIAD